MVGSVLDGSLSRHAFALAGFLGVALLPAASSWGPSWMSAVQGRLAVALGLHRSEPGIHANWFVACLNSGLGLTREEI